MTREPTPQDVTNALKEIGVLRSELKSMRLDIVKLDSATLGDRRDRAEFKKSLQGRIEEAEGTLTRVEKVVVTYQSTINRYLGIFLTALVTGAAGFLIARLVGG